MMATTINSAKESAEADTPLLFFECLLPQGGLPMALTQHWCTHAISLNGQPYAARVLKHNLFDLQLSADDAMDGVTKLSITLADADAVLAELNAAVGFKGSQLTVHFAFADLPTGTITTESTVLFRGVASDPDEISEDSLTLTFTNKLSLQRVPVPEVRIQRSCPWNFPATLAQRIEAAKADPSNRFSPFYRCGYSADVQNGSGNLMPSGQPYTSCNKSRSDCQARGMFNINNANQAGHFGGFEFVPSAVTVRTSGSSTTHLSPLLDNLAKYNDPVPIVYGQGWLKAPVIFSRNDGNLTHMEVLLGMGQIGSQSSDGVLKVVVNDVEIPKGVDGQDMTTTGSYKVFTVGARDGGFNLDFTSNNQPLGDPYGSMAAMSVVVPNRISSGTSLPNVQVLLQGVAIDTYNTDGTLDQTTWSDNPAWVILDILRRCGWSTSDLDLSTFASSASHCSELIAATDLNGNAAQVARFKCNLILTKRQSAAVVVRGIRVASSLMLRYGLTGLLELIPETSLEEQHPGLPDGGNSLTSLNNGYPAYEFSDGSLPPFSGIVRNPNGTSTLRFTSRSVAETSNRLSVEFQDEWNEYQQDSLSVVDSDDSGLLGYEISSQSTALGIANFSQATRVLLQQLDKTIYGNLFVQFQTSFRALKIRPGDIIALSSSRPILSGADGSTRVPFRVVKLSPSLNYQLVTIVAQIHDDNWYSDNPAVLGGAGRQPSTLVQTPRPLIGLVRHPATGPLEFFDFNVTEDVQTQSGGNTTDILTVYFAHPTKPSANSPSLPLLSLSPIYDTSIGTLPPSTNSYYAVSAVDAAGNEGPLSFTVLAQIGPSSATNSVKITGLSFPSGSVSFNVYKGSSPQMLYQIASGVSIRGAQGQVISSYVDSGATTPNPVGPPDPNFDHANFYWRYEYSSAYMAGTYSATKIGPGTGDSWSTPGVYVGKVVRILEGTGRGQERSIISNDETTLTVNPAWSVIPDTTSMFVVTEGSWRFGAVTATSPAQFEIPYAIGDAIQISGRGANVNNQEGTADLCPLTRLTLGRQTVDGGIPPTPTVQIGTPGGGEVVLSQIGFDSAPGNPPPNTESISSGTLQLFYWDETQTTIPSKYALTTTLDAVTTTFSPGTVADPPPSFTIQVGEEIMTITAVDAVANTYTVRRAVLNSLAQAHQQGDSVLHLGTSMVVVPFSPGFFENSASLNYIHTFSLPDIYISAAEFFVTNSYGDSVTNTQCLATDDSNMALRTLSGGQFSLQVSGYLATQQNAAPPLIMGDAPHAVRDLRATVGQAASGYNISIDILQNGSQYCNLIIASGETSSSVTSGFDLPPLSGDTKTPPIVPTTLTMNVTLQMVSIAPATLTPGRDLTVTIRL